MTNPYFIDEPAAVISFSGGRTSAYMLYKILEAHGGKMPRGVQVVFANTGKEFNPQTLDFVQACSANWNVPIVWLEYSGKKSFIITDYEHASRNGEPFAQLISDKNYLPNMVARFCTSELKVLTIERFMHWLKMYEFTTAVGMRADEPRRVAKMKAKENYICPLADAGVIEQDIFEFWSDSDFDLNLPMGTSNCDLCFLKGMGVKSSLVRAGVNPDWWIEKENKINARFRSDQPSYAEIKEIALNQSELFAFDDESIPCFCGD